MKLFGKSYKTTNKLPKDIEVTREDGNYEKRNIENAGYKEYNKTTSKTLGGITIWKHPDKSTTLIFVEKPNGLYKFGGYVQ